jgi:DNA-binding transcriptional MocR family regulator
MIDLTGPSRAWSATLAGRFAACQDRALHGDAWWASPAAFGEPALLDRLAELFGAPPDRTVVTGGVRQFATACTVRGAAGYVESPSFADIAEILEANGPVRGFSWTELLDGTMAGAPAGTIWLTSPFRNPDGRSLTPALDDALATLVARGHTAVVNEVYRWFYPAAAVPRTPAAAWSVTSLAKVGGGGLRLGWAVAPPGSAMTRPMTSIGPPTAWQRGCAAFLDERNWRALWSDTVEPTLDARAAFVGQVRERLGWAVPGGGLSLLLDCVDMTEAEGVERLAATGLRVSPGSAFRSAVPSVRLAFSGVSVAEAVSAGTALAAIGDAFRPGALR